jgi:hypothetical protein
MDTRSLLHAEIDKLGPDELEQVFQLVRGISRSRDAAQAPGLLARLRRIEIDAPEDFAENLDGERRADE